MAEIQGQFLEAPRAAKATNSQASDLVCSVQQTDTGAILGWGEEGEGKREERRNLKGPRWAPGWRGLRGAPGPHSEDREEMCLFILY